MESRDLPVGIDALSSEDDFQRTYWLAWNKDSVIGKFWSSKSADWYCWALRECKPLKFTDVASCLTYISSVYLSSKRKDDSARAALLSILRD